MRTKYLASVAALFFASAGALGQEVEWLSPKNLGKWSVPAGNYSGITPVGNGQYAVVSDKETRDGFYLFQIEQDLKTGQVTRVENKGFFGTDSSLRKGRDAEGVAFTPNDSLVWISGEADQRILAHRLDGTQAGRELAVPSSLGLKAITPNYGFEALCHDKGSGLFWTMTENALPVALRADSLRTDNDTVYVPLQSFGSDGLPLHAYAYPLDKPETETKGRQYAYGAVALWARGDGKLWVMEREINVPKKRLKARTHIKIYEISPQSAAGFPQKITEKRLVADFSTRMRMVRPKLANYEGLCEGARLNDGRRTWLIVSDSQGGYGNKLCHLRDWIRVGVSQGTD